MGEFSLKNPTKIQSSLTKNFVNTISKFESNVVQWGLPLNITEPVNYRAKYAKYIYFYSFTILPHINFVYFYLLIYCVILNYILVKTTKINTVFYCALAIAPQFTGCSIYIPITSLQFIQTYNGLTNNDILF